MKRNWVKWECAKAQNLDYLYKSLNDFGLIYFFAMEKVNYSKCPLKKRPIMMMMSNDIEMDNENSLEQGNYKKLYKNNW